MQTFLPYPSFERSAKVLDRQRLGKQRVETMQILKALSGEYSKGWVNHPATKMWRGHEEYLIKYGVAICDEWTGRGYKDTCREKIISLGKNFSKSVYPKWMGNREFHKSHKSNLTRKDEKHYKKFWPSVPSDLEYVWPE
jgi:hypothetical protein